MKDKVFPVQNSTLSEKALLPWMLDKYSLPEFISCKFHRKGSGICDTYVINTAERDYYLKIFMHGRRTKLDVSEEVRLLNYLVKNGVSVSMPIVQKDGSYVSQLTAPEGARYTVLYEGAKGVEGDTNENRIIAFGDMVARFHQCSDRMPGVYRRKHLDMKHLIDENLTAIAALMAHRIEDYKIIENTGEYCKKQVQKLLSKSKPEYGICHGDLHGGDVRYKEDNTPVIFDFDSSGYGWRALDIGVFQGTPDWMDTSDEAEQLRRAQLSLFMEGYSRHRRLSENELSIVQLTPFVRHIFLFGHFLRYYGIHQGNYFANDDYIDWHMEWFRNRVDRVL
jgi:Ser/Thr protein kinase RdoA (MazF antagonist)